MRSGGQTRSPNVSDNLSTLNAISLTKTFFDAIEMGIGSVIRTRMVDTNDIAIPTLPTSEGDLSACDSAHRSATRRSEIDAFVRPSALQNRMETSSGKHRRNARKFQWITKKCSADGRGTGALPLFWG